MFYVLVFEPDDSGTDRFVAINSGTLVKCGEDVRVAVRGAMEGDDLGAPDEEILAAMHEKPLVITHYPKAVKAFYMKEAPDDPTRVLAMDIIGPEGAGELIGGSQREEDLDTLLAWKGKTQTSIEVLSLETCRRMQATLDQTEPLRSGDALPTLWHFASAFFIALRR